jgi:hypothetical protein
MADLLVKPISDALLACFCEALINQHGTTLMVDGGTLPGECCYRVGEAVSADASEYEDLCCSGLAWVRIDDIFSTSDDFPAPDTSVVITGCGPLAWGVVLEMGVLRCAPTGDISTVPTCEEWTAMQEAIFLDQAAMREAMCCLIGQLDPSSVAIGSWNPLPTSGGCGGSTWQITVQIPCGDC